MDKEKIYSRIREKYGTVDLRKPFKVYDIFENLVNYFGEDLSETLVESFLKDYRKDYILENLQTHDYKKLFNALKLNFPNISFNSCLEPSKEKAYFVVGFVGTKEHPTSEHIKELKNSQKLKDLAAFYGYKTTIKGNFIEFEPIYTENANNFVYNNCHGTVYHITSRENAEKILNSGLRTRTGDPNLTTRANPPRENYRNFPKRIYVSAFDTSKTKDIKSELEDIANTVGESEDLVAIRIRIPDRKIPFYIDTAMVGLGEGNSFYTYTNIPASYVDYIIDL